MKIAIAQLAPAFLNRDAGITAVVHNIAIAAAAGAKLLVFPEAFIAGYPVWIWRLRPGTDHAQSAALHCSLVDQACRLNSEQLAPIFAAAREHNISVVCGINERADQGSQTALFNTALIISQNGELLNRHRKLVPTNAEKMVWAQGDASGLKVCSTEAGRLGTLICWENYLPLARYALYNQGMDIYIAPTYDSGDTWLSSMRHIARESGCWVISANNAFQAADLAPEILSQTQAYPDPDEWVNPGDSVVIAPNGQVIAGPWHQQQGVFYADIDLSQTTFARRSLDVAGHSARPDIFDFAVHARPFDTQKL